MSDNQKSDIKPGVKTSEFKGKLSIQIVCLAVMLLNHFKPEWNLDDIASDQVCLTIAGLLEGVYILGRSKIKGDAEIRFGRESL